jgi:glucose/arabinose dehydrogenase
MEPRRGRALAVGIALAFVSGTLLGPSPQPAAGAREAVASGLEWPVSFAFVRAEGAAGLPVGTILYNERLTGNLRAITPQNPAPGFVVASVPVSTSGEKGLLGLALPPDFGAVPYVYAYHTYFDAAAGRDVNRVVRWWLGVLAPPGPGPAPMEVVLDGIPAATFHNGGILGFAGDGTLFVTTGDAGDQGDAPDNASLAGKVLRLNPDGSLPADNPLPGSPVYTVGHRNVFGLGFHPITGEAYVSENGPGGNDEVNVLEPGKNYGWPVGTGALGDPRFVDPILTYPSSIAPTGLAFYTGTREPAWTGALFLGDWNRGRLHRLPLGGPTYRAVLGDEIVDDVGAAGVLDVEDGPDGDLYVSTPDAIYRVRAGGGPGFPLGILLVLAGVAVLVVGFAVAVWRERRRGSPPPAPPPRPPPP